MQIRAIGLFALGALCAFSSIVHAARVIPGSGTVSVNRGSGFAQINEPVDAKIGDSVVVSEGGKAKIECDDGTIIEVTSGQIFTICNPPHGANVTTGSTAAGGLGTGAIVGLGAVAAGVGIAAAAGGGKKKNNPASP